MTKVLRNGTYTGERALYNSNSLEIYDSVFEDGESPLKESSDLKILNSTFRWKYPLWYCNNVECENVILEETARSGIWYTNNISFKDSKIIAPKIFRRASNIVLKNVNMENAEETFWGCKNIKLNNVYARGNYFCMNSKNIEIEDFQLDGNYAFDGAENVTIKNAILNSKDSFWNTKNVTVYDSTIIGEYLGWNSENLTFINCTIESNQGMCYIKNIKMENCILNNTDLCFELCEDVDATINSSIDSVKNPISGYIKAKEIKEIILDEKMIDASRTTIIVENK